MPCRSSFCQPHCSHAAAQGISENGVLKVPRPRAAETQRQESRIKKQEKASSRKSSPQQHVGYLTPIFRGSQSQIHNNSSLPFNSFTQIPQSSPFYLRRLRASTNPAPGGIRTPPHYSIILWPRLDHASIRARIRQALASLHKLRAPGSVDASLRRRLVNEPLKAGLGDPPGKRSRFKTNEDGREASSPHRPRCG